MLVHRVTRTGFQLQVGTNFFCFENLVEGGLFMLNRVQIQTLPMQTGGFKTIRATRTL
jgi:hypothetical protein